MYLYVSLLYFSFYSNEFIFILLNDGNLLSEFKGVWLWFYRIINKEL